MATGTATRWATSPRRLDSYRSTAVYGESDRIPSTEVVEDPDEGENDPAAGPNLSADRGSEPHDDR